MRIIKTTEANHRYAKVLSTTSQGIIGRLYLEVENRKFFESATSTKISKQESLLELLKYQVESIKVQNKKISDIINKIFPDGESWAVIEKSLLVMGKIKGESLELSTTDEPPVKVESKILVENLNVEMLGGSTLKNIEDSATAKVSKLASDTANNLKTERTTSTTMYAPKSHVNEGGPGVHPYVTTKLAGFMSPVDKSDHDKMKEKTDRIELPGGIMLSNEPPMYPRMMEVWIDTSDIVPKV